MAWAPLPLLSPETDGQLPDDEPVDELWLFELELSELDVLLEPLVVLVDPLDVLAVEEPAELCVAAYAAVPTASVPATPAAASRAVSLLVRLSPVSRSMTVPPVLVTQVFW